MKPKALLARLSRGEFRNVRFTDFVRLIEAYDFQFTHSTGSHQYYARPGVDEVLNIQERRGELKAYQARQLLSVIERYNLELGEDA